MDVEKKHRYAHGLDRREEPSVALKVQARSKYSELAEFHLVNHERLLEKYAGALIPANREELALAGDDGPIGEAAKKEYRAMIALRGMEPEKPGAEKRYPTIAAIRQALAEDKTVVSVKTEDTESTNGMSEGEFERGATRRHGLGKGHFGEAWMKTRFHELTALQKR